LVSANWSISKYEQLLNSKNSEACIFQRSDKHKHAADGEIAPLNKGKHIQEEELKRIRKYMRLDEGRLARGAPTALARATDSGPVGSPLPLAGTLIPVTISLDLLFLLPASSPDPITPTHPTTEKKY